MHLRALNKFHFINQLEALQKYLSEIISESKTQSGTDQLYATEIFNLSSDCFCILDTDANFLKVNAAFTRYFGNQTNGLVSKSFISLVPFVDQKIVLEYLDKLSIGFPRVSFKCQVKSKDGHFKPLIWKGQKKGERLYLAGQPDLTGHSLKNPKAPEIFNSNGSGQPENTPPLYNKNAAAMSTAGINGVITSINQCWLGGLGYEQHEVLGKEFSAFFDEPTLKSIKDQCIPQIAKVGRTDNIDGKMLTKTGRKVDASFTIFATPNSAFFNCNWLIFFSETTGRHHADGKIENKQIQKISQEPENFTSEKNLRAIINSSQQILFLIDKGLKIIAFNKHAEAIIRNKADRKLAVGDNFLNFIPRQDIDSFKEVFASVLLGKVVHLSRELRFKHLKRWYQVYIHPVINDSNQVNNVVFSAEDITDRKVAEEKFKELEINFKSIFSQVAVSIVLFNIDLEILKANRRFYQMVEYTADEYKLLGPVGVTHPEDRENSNKKLSALISGKVGHYSIEKRYVTKSGKILWVYLTATLVRNRQGKPKHIISVIQDITARKNAEQELIYKKNELDTFVYRASHDLRGPVASLMGLYNIVKKEFAHNKQALDYFEHYNNSVVRLHAVLQNLIDLTKIKDSETKLSQVDIKVLVDNCLKSFEGHSNFKHIKFFVETDIDFKIFIDGKKFRSILNNLVENAIVYCTPEDKAFVKIIISYQDNVLKMDVIDNGRGIDPKIQGKVFNMFFRGNEVSPGAGLGLYIVKNAVEKLNGSIQLTSKINEGTKVSVYIPYLYEQEYATLLEKNFIN